MRPKWHFAIAGPSVAVSTSRCCIRRHAAQLAFFVAMSAQKEFSRGFPRKLDCQAGKRAMRAVSPGQVANNFQHLDDLYAAALDGSGERQLTHLNSKL